MSNNESGQVASTSGALGAALVGGVVMAGVLCYQGIMLYGRILNENYAAFCNEVEKMRMENMQREMAKVDTTLAYFKKSQNYIAAHAARLALDSPPLNDISQSVQNTRIFIDAGKNAVHNLEQMQQQYQKERLEIEIQLGKGKLPEPLLQRAEQALQSSNATMENMLNEMQQAWQQVASSEMKSQYDREKLDLTIKEYHARLSALKILLSDQENLPTDHFERQVNDVEKLIHSIENASNAVVMGNLERIEKELDYIAEGLARSIQHQQEARAKSIATIEGKITALTNIVNEAQSTLLLADAVSLSFLSSLESLQTQVTNIDTKKSGKTLGDLQKSVLEQEQVILSSITSAQKNRIARIVQDTLEETGFTEQDVKEFDNTEQIKITSLRHERDEQGNVADREVEFTINQNGEVGYDFKGYVGESCLKDAKRVLDSLADKGIFIIEESRLRQLQYSTLSPEVLRQNMIQPAMNKEQAILSEKILNVLRKMGYQIIHHETIGSTIYFDASHDGVGYYSVTIDSQGDYDVFTDPAHENKISAIDEDDLIQQLQQGQSDAQNTDSGSSNNAYDSYQQRQLESE